MPRPEKVQAVADISERFEEARAVFLTEYRGIPVKAMGDLRRRLRAAGADYKVVKMSLARRAADGLGIEGLVDHLDGPTALAFANDDPVGVAKALNDYAKENENLVIKLGLLADKVLQPEDVARLAAIEPREVLLAKIAGAAKSPLFSLAGMMASFTRDAAGMFGQLLEKKESEPGAPAESEEISPRDEDAQTADAPEAEMAETPIDETAIADTDTEGDDDSTEDSSDQAEEE